MSSTKLGLALVWSLNGLLEKSLLAHTTPQGYATTKAVCVAASYLATAGPRSLDLALLLDARAWVLVLVSFVNTPLYARIARDENPAIALPVVVALSQALRLVWMSLFFAGHEWRARQLLGVAFAITGSLCIGGG